MVQYKEMSRFTDSAQGEAVLALPCCIAAGCSPVKRKLNRYIYYTIKYIFYIFEIYYVHSDKHLKLMAQTKAMK